MNVGDVLVRKETGERFLIGRITKAPARCRVYVIREGLNSEEVWDNSCVMLEDLPRLFEIVDDGLGDLDI